MFCTICGCSELEVIKLFCFPKNSQKHKLWTKALGIDDKILMSGKARICENHFEKEDFVPCMLPLKLKPTAIPQRWVPENKSTTEIQQYDEDTSDENDDYEIVISASKNINFHKEKSSSSVNNLDSGTNDTVECRLCLHGTANADGFQIFDSEEHNLIENATISEMLQFCCPSIKISMNDGFSQLICIRCFDQLVSSYKFFKNTQENQQLLINRQSYEIEKPNEKTDATEKEKTLTENDESEENCAQPKNKLETEENRIIKKRRKETESKVRKLQSCVKLNYKFGENSSKNTQLINYNCPICDKKFVGCKIEQAAQHIAVHDNLSNFVRSSSENTSGSSKLLTKRPTFF